MDDEDLELLEDLIEKYGEAEVIQQIELICVDDPDDDDDDDSDDDEG
jgi:hypothetical protein